jgi:hypothetical protein
MFLRPEEGTRTYRKSLLGLIGHMIGTAGIFLSLFFLAWLIEVVLTALHNTHPFPADVLDVARSVELWLVYADIVLCAVVLGAGFIRFARDVIGGR